MADPCPDPSRMRLDDFEASKYREINDTGGVHLAASEYRWLCGLAWEAHRLRVIAEMQERALQGCTQELGLIGEGDDDDGL